MQSSTRVIFNTGIQYARTLISVCIALYSSRIILQSLGVSDYGIYSLVGGIISLLSFLHGSLASTTQRYLSFYQGKNDMEMQVKFFNNSVFIQLLLGLILALGMFLLTPFIFDGFLNIPPDRIDTATVVYYCMIASVFFTVISTPYLAALIAHENILYSSLVQILEAFLKLSIAVSLLYFFQNKLVYYALMMTLVPAVSFFMYLIYGSRKYNECKHISIKKFDRGVLKEIFSFSGWTVYSAGCVIARTQGIAIIVNRFLGTAANAAYGIAQQLQGQISFISGSLINAIKPQIMKAEGDRNRQKMFRLSEIASKFSFLLLAMISIPTVFEMGTLLSLWLGKVPAHTVMFARFVILTSLVDQLTVGLIYANQAIGNIKYYSLVINTIKVLTLPVAYFCLYMGLPPVSVMLSMLMFEFICSMARLFFLKKTGGLLIFGFVERVFVPEIIPLVSTLFVCLFCYLLFPDYLFWLSFIFSGIVMSITAYAFGMCEDEKQIIDELLTKFKNKIKK